METRYSSLAMSMQLCSNLFVVRKYPEAGGHHSEVWALALSHHSKFVVTGSHDKSIRVWEKLDEPVRPVCQNWELCTYSRVIVAIPGGGARTRAGSSLRKSNRRFS